MADEKSRSVLSQDNKKNTPIILVPGLASFLAIGNWKRILKKNGYSAETANLYAVMAAPTIDEQARVLALEIEKILARLKAKKCHLLAFSMGGITALHFLKKYNFRARVEKCVCVSSPFHGIKDYLNILLPLKILIKGLPEIMRGNNLLAKISEKENMPAEKIFTVRGGADWLCEDKSGRLPFGKNLPAICGGHIFICCGLNKQAVNQILMILSD